MHAATTESEPFAKDGRTGYLAVAAAASLCCLLASAQQTEGVRLPYIWPNVAAAYFIGSLPLGMLVEAMLRSRLRRPVALLIGLVGLLLAVLVMSGREPHLQIPGGWLPRTACSLLVATSSLVFCHALLSKAGRRGPMVPRVGPLTIAVGVALAAVVPSLYMDSRCQYHRQRLGDLVGQFRLGPARELADQLNAVAPRLDVNGLMVSQVAAELNTAVAGIESQVAEPLPRQSAPADRLDRARQMAILGRLEEVENVLAPLVRADARNPLACNLLGLTYEGSGQWLQSRYWYFEAYQILTNDTSQQVHDDLLQAVMGIAYAERKLGHYREAEIAYHRALELDSSAAMHFLMAQFYEDSQQATKAHQHAALAIQMDPARYRAAGRELIDQLEINHFGCMSVFWRRKSTGSDP